MFARRPTGNLSCVAKNFNCGHYTKTVQPNVFIHVLLIDTIDCCHFIPLSLTLTLPGGHKIRAKPIAFIFSHTFNLIITKFDVVMQPFKLNIMRLLLSTILHKRELSAVLQTASTTVTLACIQIFIHGFNSNMVG